MLRPPLPQAGGQSAPLGQSPGLDPVLTPPGSPLLRVSQLSRRGMMGTLRAMPNLQVYHRDNPLPAPPGAGKVWGAQAALLDRAWGLDLAPVARRALAADTPALQISPGAAGTGATAWQRVCISIPRDPMPPRPSHEHTALPCSHAGDAAARVQVVREPGCCPTQGLPRRARDNLLKRKCHPVELPATNKGRALRP